MAAGTVPAVYATALLELARERGSYDAVVAACRQLQADFPAQALRDLDDPRIGKSRAKAIIARLFEGAPKELADFCCLLIDRDRLRDLQAIVEEVDDLDDRAKGVTEVAVTSAAPLGAAARERIERSLRAVYGDRFELLASVDPALIGGFTMRIGDRFVDASSRRKLAEMKAAILASPLDDGWIGAA